MKKCTDGHAYIRVEGYQRKDGVRVKGYKRRCPYRESQSFPSVYLCCVCGEEHELSELNDVEIKGQIKKVCEECVDTVHGLI
jgi:hypothetical protein